MVDNQNELLPIVDSRGKTIGAALRSICHNGSSRLLHPVVHLHVFDAQGRLLLQKRSNNKRIQPGRWDTAVGGHVACGESPLKALRREALEEIGLRDVSTAKLLDQYLFESPIEREMIYCYAIQLPVSADRFLTAEPDEIEQLRFWTAQQIESNLHHGLFTPNFELEYLRIVKPQIYSDEH